MVEKHEDGTDKATVRLTVLVREFVRVVYSIYNDLRDHGPCAGMHAHPPN